MTKAEMMLKMSGLAAELEAAMELLAAANETQFLSDEIIAEYRVTQAQRDTEIERLKAELALQGNAQAALVSLSKQYNLVWHERNELAAMYHQALENAQAAQAEIATMKAELSALQPAIDPDVDTEVQRQFKALWDSCDEPGYTIPRMYKYFVPSCVYPARVGRRRVCHYYSRLNRHGWIGGIVQREWANVLRDEGASLTHRELAKLRAYAADWDATAEQMLNDSIPW